MNALMHFAALVLLVAILALPAAAQTPASVPDPATAAADDATGRSKPDGAGLHGPPGQVKIGLYINDIQAIDLHAYSYVADVYVWFRDSEPSIVPGETFEWMNMFDPEGHVQTTIYEVPRPQPDGSEYQVFRHQGPFAAKFSVKTFPFDAHKLTIEIEDREWDANRLVYVADEVAINPKIELPGFIIGMPTIEIVNRPYPTAFGDLATPDPAPYSRAVITIPISRPILSGITKALLPVFIVVLVAAAALLLDPQHIEARVGLSITALLTLVALQLSATAGLPEVGYLLMLDQVYLASYAFVLLVVALLVLATGKEDQIQRMDGVGAHTVGKGGPLTAFLAVLLYGAIIGVVLYLNIGKAA